MLLYINSAQKIRNITMKCKFFIFFLLLTYLVLNPFSQSFAQDQEEATPVEPPQELTLVRAVMCEGLREELRGLVPLNEAIAFSIKREEVSCFLDFAAVPEKTTIRISWFWRDERRLNRKFTLYPPRWSTLDTMQLRDADKGPWRVEVRDMDGNILKTLRFSITD
jgi:hypothetical protein